MRILFVTICANNRYSGMGKWSHEVADALRAAGHHAELWFVEDFPSYSWLTFPIDLVLLKPFQVAERVAKAAKQFDAVVIHEASGFWYGLLRQFNRELPPLISMSHGVESRDFDNVIDLARKGYGQVPLGRRLRTRLLRTWQSDGTIRMADAAICLSTLDRSYMIERLHRNPRDTFLMINGVAREHFVGNAESRTGRRVLFVGSWIDRKGRTLLPQIWGKVLPACPDARLSLVGTHAPRDEVLKLFPAAQHATIDVIPRVAAHEMPAIFDRHDLLLMPSLNEGSPLALLEAMASAMPVVASAVGGIPDIITHGVDGLIFDSLDASTAAGHIRKLFEDSACATRLARAARERAAQLTWSSAAQTLLGAVEQVARPSANEARMVAR
jgi:glycosyltransferase involved in cell wall biosynthesis